MTFKEKVKKHLNDIHIFKKLEKYVYLIEKHNKVINLTGFSHDKLWEEGIYESILSLEDFIKNGKLLDIGAGVGFPSVPFIIANPKIKLTIYEPIKKRLIFLQEVNKNLKLNISLVHIRAEESNQVEEFDFITARAVASLKILMEISHKLAKVNGKFVWIKGPKAKQEIQEAKKIIDEFKINPKITSFEIGNKIINNITYSKKIKTPIGYPRNWSQIIK